jgi:hypothetical protein
VAIANPIESGVERQVLFKPSRHDIIEALEKGPVAIFFTGAFESMTENQLKALLINDKTGHSRYDMDVRRAFIHPDAIDIVNRIIDEYATDLRAKALVERQQEKEWYSIRSKAMLHPKVRTIIEARYRTHKKLQEIVNIRRDVWFELDSMTKIYGSSTKNVYDVLKYVVNMFLKYVVHHSQQQESIQGFFNKMIKKIINPYHNLEKHRKHAIIKIVEIISRIEREDGCKFKNVNNYQTAFEHLKVVVNDISSNSGKLEGPIITTITTNMAKEIDPVRQKYDDVKNEVKSLEESLISLNNNYNTAINKIFM